MLNYIDRIQIVTAEAGATARMWEQILEARIDREDRVPALGARRTVLRAGSGEVEFLQPDGKGAIADFMTESGRGGLYAVGFAASEIPALRDGLRSRGVQVREDRDQLFVDTSVVPGGGLRLVISPPAPRTRAGVMTRFHEVSFLTADPASTAQSLAGTFGLDAAHFAPTESPAFGFAGVHVYLTAGQHDDIETIKAVDADKAMGRFFARRGPSLYMAFGESDDMERVRTLAIKHAPDDWTGPREGPAQGAAIFVHPRALGGVMLGIRASTV